MTTAHRPTWKPAYGLADSVGKGYIPTRSYSARDLPGYLKLKERQWGQGSVDQLQQKDFKSELLKREAAARRTKNGDIQIIQEQQNGKRTIHEEDVDFINQFELAPRKKLKKPQEQVGQQQQQGQQKNPFPEDEDSEEFVREEIHEKRKKRIQSDEDQDQDDEDDDEELLREYQKIKQQRQKQELFRKQEKHKQSMMNRETQLLKGNPLVDSSYSISKRWYEDTVFRNQAKKMEEKKSFVNDYVRSEFHRKFMNRYVCR